jgi:hydrogenase expression/formation protein HypC
VCLAVPGQVMSRRDRGGIAMAEVDIRGERREICLELVPDAQPGDWVLVHLGFALEQVDEATARDTLATAERLSGH